MKDCFEDSKTFTAYATIDAAKYMMGEMLKQLMSEKRSPIGAAVDKACGYNPYLKYYESLTNILPDIIEAKKVLEVDYSSEQGMLEASKKYILENTQPQ